MQFTAALLALVTLAAAAPSPQSSVPPNSQVEIQEVTYGGTGCPENTAQGLISDDRSTITLSFDAYTVQSGANSPASDRRKFCQLQMKLKYPGGFQYSILGADFRGYASLDSGVNGTAQSTYYFSGQPNESTFTANFTGPMDDNYILHDEVDSVSTVWSPCGDPGLLNIKSEVRIAPLRTTSLNLLTVDSFDSKFTQKYAVQWQKCNV
ncbi:secreted protein [Stagonosporopsis vannaccii]|nr:secreted protein [Stagonosporopsis vannaccii]